MSEISDLNDKEDILYQVASKDNRHGVRVCFEASCDAECQATIT